MRTKLLSSILVGAFLAVGSLNLHAQELGTISYQGRVTVLGTNFTGVGLFKFALVDPGQTVPTRRATGTVTLGVPGKIISAMVTDSGMGYTAVPQVRVIDSGRDGAGAKLTASVSGGQVIGITVVSQGSFYGPGTTIAIDPPPSLKAYKTFWSHDGTSAQGSEPSSAVTLSVNDGLFTLLLGDTALANMNALPSAVFTNGNARARIWFNDGTRGFAQLTPDQPLGSAGYAMMAAGLAPGAVGNAQIADGAVRGNHLGAQSVVGAAIAMNTINSGHLQAGAVQNSHIAAGAIEGSRIASGAISSNNIAPGAVHRVHLAADAVFTNATGQFGLVPPGGIILSPSATPPQAGYSLVGAMELGSGDAWQVGNTIGAPPGTFDTAAVWTGVEMVTWSGFQGAGPPNGYCTNGGRYNPATDTWQPVSAVGAPKPRSNAMAVWTGTEMIVWGGKPTGTTTNDGAIYKPSTDTWRPMTMVNAPAAMMNAITAWTGSRMLLWGREGGDTPGLAFFSYTPGSDSWERITTNGSPVYRYNAMSVWTGSELIIWGGAFNPTSNIITNDGARYRLSDSTWRPLPAAGAPSARHKATAVWTGSRMIIWGGSGQAGTLNDGAIYNPTTDAWTPMSAIGAPASRVNHVAVWNGMRMIVWSGTEQLDVQFRSGGMYDPVSDSWLPTATAGAPSGRYGAKAFWTSSRMLIYSGSSGSYYPPEPQLYDPTKGLLYMHRWQ